MIGQSPGLIAFLLVKSQFIFAEMCAYSVHTYEPTHTHAQPEAHTFTHLHLHTTPPSHCCFMMDGAEDAQGKGWGDRL